MSEDADENLAAAEPSVTTFDATIRSVEGREVTLDRTYFYAEGGGQPADRGTLAGVDVVDVQTRDGVTVHTLADPLDAAPGDRVEGRLDESFRTYCMRAHTASHIVYGAGRKVLDSHGYGGFDIDDDRIRIDFETEGTESVNPLTIQRLANEAVWDGRQVDWYEMDVDEARRRADIVFNLGTVDVSDTVRIVEIEDWDVSACGGTHVRNTAEVGPIRVEDVSNPGADLVRVEYAVGPTAIQAQIDERRNARRAAEALDTGVADLPRQAERLAEELETVRTEFDDLRDQLLDARLGSLASETVATEGEEWLVGTVDAADANTVADKVRDLADETADVVVLAGGDGSTFLVVGAGGDTDATDVVDDVTAEFGGGGGGQPVLAQGGGIDADPEAVVEYVHPDRD